MDISELYDYITPGEQQPIRYGVMDGEVLVLYHTDPDSGKETELLYYTQEEAEDTIIALFPETRIVKVQVSYEIKEL